MYRKAFSVPPAQGVSKYLKSIEDKWRLKLGKRLERDDQDGKLPRYILSMFPYPSGRLHLGHVRIYTSADILTRFSKLLARNNNYVGNFSSVINPMGFDSFGLPAENAAKERGLNPANWTNSNIRSMKKQLDDLGLQFDWREATSNPSFYHWTQELFIKLMESNLVYKSYAQVNWDPVDRTVLADEQVDENGCSWRSGAKVERRYYRQWFVKVNAFLNDIYEARDVNIDHWADILAIQRNWVGTPTGWIFYIPVVNKSNQPDILTIFTENPELFLSRNTRVALPRDHWLAHVYQDNPVTSISNPFLNNPMKIQVDDTVGESTQKCHATLINDNDDEPDLMSREKVLLLSRLYGLGGYFTSNSYRDWLVSRQRFWGTPIPAINCTNCGLQAVPRISLPILLPKVQSLNDKQRIVGPVDATKSITPIEEVAPDEWLHTKCHRCDSIATRECETFDTLFDSSWYFLRYASEPCHGAAFDPSRTQPVWCYIGGKEHASMHLFYARFITHFLYSLGELKFREPFERLFVQGVVKGRTYKLNGRYLTQAEAESINSKENLVIEYEKMSKSKGNGVDPQELLDTYGVDATRLCLMSYANPRSERLWRNNQEEFKDILSFIRRVLLTLKEYTDSGRLLRDQEADGIKITELSEEELASHKSRLVEARNRCSLEATLHLQETFQLRQYISALHVFLNSLRGSSRSTAVYTLEFASALGSFIVMLSPITPYISEELWAHFSNCMTNPLLNSPKSPFDFSLQAREQPWPLCDEDYPLMMNVFDESTSQVIERLPIQRDELRALSRDEVRKRIKEYLNNKKDGPYILSSVTIYDDLRVNALVRYTGKAKRKRNIMKEDMTVSGS